MRRSALHPAALIVLAGLAGACSGELTPQSLVEGFRILAVRADVPEAAPGEVVALDALLADPAGEGRAVARLWVACVLGPSRNPEACADPAGGGIVGIGFEPTFSFVAPTPEDPEAGDQVLITMTTCAGGTIVLPTDGGMPTGDSLCDGGDGATAYKRVTISTGDERNHNPTLVGMALDGAEWPAEPRTLPACEPSTCEALEIAATLGEGAAETWTEIAFGSPRQRTEEVFVSWFASAGSFARIRSGAETPEVQWTPPDGPATVDFWFVVHDGRGGTDFTSRQLVFE